MCTSSGSGTHQMAERLIGHQAIDRIREQQWIGRRHEYARFTVDHELVGSTDVRGNHGHA